MARGFERGRPALSGWPLKVPDNLNFWTVPPAWEENPMARKNHTGGQGLPMALDA